MKKKRLVDPALADLLVRISRDERSFGAMAKATDTASDTYARIARGDGGMSGDSAFKLAKTYGARYGFTEDQVREWAHMEPREHTDKTPLEPDDATLLANAELGRLMVDAQREFETPEDYELFRQTAVDVVRALYETSKRRRKRKMP